MSKIRLALGLAALAAGLVSLIVAERRRPANTGSHTFASAQDLPPGPFPPRYSTRRSSAVTWRASGTESVAIDCA